MTQEELKARIASNRRKTEGLIDNDRTAIITGRDGRALIACPKDKTELPVYCDGIDNDSECRKCHGYQATHKGA